MLERTEKNAPAMAYASLVSATAEGYSGALCSISLCDPMDCSGNGRCMYKVNVSANQAGLVMHATRKNVLQMQQALSATVMVSVLK